MEGEEYIFAGSCLFWYGQRFICSRNEVSLKMGSWSTPEVTGKNEDVKPSTVSGCRR